MGGLRTLKTLYVSICARDFTLFCIGRTQQNEKHNLEDQFCVMENLGK